MISADPRVRKKHVHLRTQQRRLRHLTNISGFNLGRVGSLSLDKDATVHFTLHNDAESPAFYDSETTTDVLNPRWRSFDSSQFPEDVSTSLASVTVKVWMTTGKECILIVEWTVCLAGLHYLGNQLPKNDRKFKPNSLIFGMFEGYYTSSDCLQTWQLTETTNMTITLLSAEPYTVRHSYNVSSLQRIHTVQRAIKQTQVSIWRIRNHIYGHLQQRQRNEHMHLQLERGKMNVDLLKEELQAQKVQLVIERDQLLKLQASVEEKMEGLKSNTKILKEEKLKLQEDRKRFSEKRELLLKTTAQLILRRRQLISELAYIYPITEVPGKQFTICGVVLPNSENFTGCDETAIAVALGHVTHSVLMMVQFLDVPLRYLVNHLGSRSKITDHIMDKIPDRDREFPLYTKGRERVHFNYGVYLLNKNVAQLRYYCGMITQDLRATLPNLQSLMQLQLEMKFDFPAARSHLWNANRTTSVNSRDSIVVRPSGKQPNRDGDGHFNNSNCMTPETPCSLPCSENNDRYSDPKLDSLSVDSLQRACIGNRHMKRTDGVSNNVFSYSLDKGLNELEISKYSENHVSVLNDFCRPKLRWQCDVHSRGSEPNLAQNSTFRIINANSNTSGHRLGGEGNFFNPSPDMWATGSSHTNSEEEIRAVTEGSDSNGLQSFLAQAAVGCSFDVLEHSNRIVVSDIPKRVGLEQTNCNTVQNCPENLA